MRIDGRTGMKKLTVAFRNFSKGTETSQLMLYREIIAVLRCVIPVVWYNNNMIICISLYLVNTSIFFSYVCYNTTFFGPPCGSSSGVSRVISHTITWRGVGGRDLFMWVFLLCNALRKNPSHPNSPTDDCPSASV